MKRIILLLIGMFFLCVGYSQTDSITFDYNNLMAQPNSNFYSIKANADLVYRTQRDTSDETSGLTDYISWKWFWQSRVDNLDPNSHGSFKIYQDALVNFMQNTFCNGSPTPYDNPWIPIGPTQDPQNTQLDDIGRITAIAVDPGNANIVYVGSSSGGLFKTLNFSATNPVWTCVTDNVRLPGLGINDVTIDPNHSNVVYIATGQLFGTSGLGVIGSGYGSGILKSVDGGLTWEQKNPGSIGIQDIAYRIKINPQYSNIIYALISDKCFKSTDGGTNWTLSLQLPNSIGLNTCATNAISRILRDIEFKPNDPNTIYCSTDDAQCAIINNGDAGATLWRSIDAGANWTQLVLDPVATKAPYISIAVTPAQPDYLFAAYIYDTYPGQNYQHNCKSIIKRSTNAGNSFTTVSNPNLYLDYFDNERNDFCVSAINANVLYIGSYWVQKSVNGGYTFDQPRSSGHVDVRKLCLAGQNGSDDILLVGNDGGIIKTINSGSTYSPKNGSGLAVTTFYGVGSGPNGDIAGGTLDNDAMFKSPNSYWYTPDARANDASDVLFDPVNTNTCYVEKWMGGNTMHIFNYQPSTNRWYDATYDMTPSNDNINSSVIRPMQILNGKLYAGFHDVHKAQTPNITSNTWTTLSNFTQYGVDPTAALVGMAVAPSDPNVIYATFTGPNWGVTQPPLLFKTIIGGGVTYNSWVDYTPNLPAQIRTSLSISKIVIDPYNPNELFISAGGICNNYGSGNNNGALRVIKSENGGASFTDYSNNLPQFPVNALIYQKGSQGGLYAATDVGVYYTNEIIYNTQGWICYNKDLPAVMITDLEIDYCKNKIIASSFGRGMWQCDLITQFPYSPPSQHITTNTTISTPALQESDLIIDPGVTLTVTSEIKFEPNAGIIVKPGASLILNGGTLNSACQGLWKGVEVWGNKTSSQYVVNNVRSQGFVQLNGGTIENAITAVQLWKSGDYSTAGGIVQANGTNFTNNKNGVVFVPYHNFNPYNNQPANNFSSFTLCHFLTNSSYYGPDLFNIFISMNDIEGVNIKGCTFINSTALSSDPAPPSRGTGIYSLDATYSVSSDCTSPYVPCPPQYTFPSEFQGLSYGVRAASGASTKSIRVFDANFNDNDRGVYLSTVNNSTIVRNNFRIGTDNTCPNQTGIGIELVNCSGYSVEQNYLTHSSTLPAGNWYIGICVKHPSYFAPITTNVIYKNTFDGLNVGGQAEGYNFDNSYQYGLYFFCNNNSGNTYDFYVMDSGIPWWQGSLTTAAGNTFSHNFNANIPGSDYTRTAGYLFGIWYYYYKGDPAQNPLYVSNVTPIGISFSNPCLSNYNSGNSTQMKLTQLQVDSLSQDFANNDVAYNNVLAIYNELKDGGNTTGTVLDVASATPAETMQLRDELLGKSPHLSEVVLKKAIDKFDVLPDPVLFEILSANPDETRNDELIKYLKGRTPAFPDYMVDLLVSLASDSTYKTTLLRSLANYNLNKTKTAYELIRNSLNDSIVDMTTLRNWLDNLHNQDADYQIIDSYLEQGNSTSASSLLDMIPTMYNLTDSSLIEYKYFNDLKKVQIELLASGNNFLQMTSDQIAILENIAAMSKGTAGSQASNILEYGYGYVNPQCPALASVSKSKSVKQTIPGLLNSVYEPKINVFPNPAVNWTSFNYELMDGTKNASIEISDMKGIMVASLRITNNKGEIIWDTRGIISGTYTYICKCGSYSKIGKITVIH